MATVSSSSDVPKNAGGSQPEIAVHDLAGAAVTGTEPPPAPGTAPFLASVGAMASSDSKVLGKSVSDGFQAQYQDGNAGELKPSQSAFVWADPESGRSALPSYVHSMFYNGQLQTPR